MMNICKMLLKVYALCFTVNHFINKAESSKMKKIGVLFFLCDES